LTFYRYDVIIEIIEGVRRPAKDVENYAKPAIDAITRTLRVWRDDEQVDSITSTALTMDIPPENAAPDLLA
jgi:Holliday junction resolvase RusA-like endonuclease